MNIYKQETSYLSNKANEASTLMRLMRLAVLNDDLDNHEIKDITNIVNSILIEISNQLGEMSFDMGREGD